MSRRQDDPPPTTDLPDGATLDRLAAGHWIFQPIHGQRWSTDDLLLAWAGLDARPDARTVLDLGAGTGSVGLLVLLGLGPGSRLTSVEVQARSVALLRRTVALGGWADRTEVLEGDLCDPSLLAGRGGYDLVLANPPYLARGSASVSAWAARASARLELHGDVKDWCRAAAGSLAPGGAFCLVFPATDPRPEPAAAAAGLTCRSRRPVVFRIGRSPAVVLYTFTFTEPDLGPTMEANPIVVRDAEGWRTEAMRAIRRTMRVE